MSEPVDFSDFLDEAPPDNILARIDAEVEVLRELNRQANEAEERTKRLKADAQFQATQVLPELMEQARQTEKDKEAPDIGYRGNKDMRSQSRVFLGPPQQEGDEGSKQSGKDEVCDHSDKKHQG